MNLIKLKYFQIKILNLLGKTKIIKLMKHQLSKFAVLLLVGFSVVACKKAKNETEAKDAEVVSEIEVTGLRYITELDKSTITWKGFAPTKSHNGYIKISEGYLTLNDNKISGGNFIIDMTTIEDLSLEDEQYNAKLEGHLSSDDFFNVKKHPFSAFTITNIQEKDGKSMIHGNLSIKGIKKNIRFPASIKVNGDEVRLKSESFTIDRTEWDIKFRSGKFFQDLKDKLINDEIEFKVDVVAKRKDTIK